MENSTDQVSHCCDLDKQGVCPYSVMFSSNCYSGQTQLIDTDNDFMSFLHIMFYEMPLFL